MSQKNNIPVSTVEANGKIYSAIRAIAWNNSKLKQGFASPSSPIMKTDITDFATGYVAAIYDDPNDPETYGTVDVQEYLTDEEYEQSPEAGLHPNVRLNAYSENQNGIFVRPKLGSDVVIAYDSASSHEYIALFSEIDVIQLDSNENINIGVNEREKAEPDSDVRANELKKTKVLSQTSYTKDQIVNEVTDGSSDSTITQTKDAIKSFVGGQTGHIIDKDKYDVKSGDTKVRVTNGTVYLGGENNVDDGVLGQALADVLIQLLDALSQVKTTTQLGPQPFVNIAQFVSLKSMVQSYKNMHKGFLTQKVKLQK